MVGNSLTNDSYPTAGVGLLAQATGASLSVHYHIRGSASLTYIAGNPNDTTLSSPSNWATALAAGSYDFVTLQPYRGLGNPTIGSELEAAVQIVEAALGASARPKTFYIYEAWPNQDDTLGDYHAYWTASRTLASFDPPLQTRQYYDELLRALRDRFGNRATFQVIPIGDVFDRIDQEARAGRIQGIASAEMLYRDSLHMGEVGRFVATTTLLSTVLKRRVNVSTGIDIYQFNDGAAELTQPLAIELEQLIWEVVASDPRSGIQATADSGESTGGRHGQGAIGFAFLGCAVLLLALRRLCPTIK
jgi:hypothetical protein